MRTLPDFSMKGEDSILQPRHCGLVNGQISTIGWHEDAAALRGLFAPPYFSDSFQLNVRLNGRRVKAQRHVWKPDELTRWGRAGRFAVVTRLVPYLGRRAFILQLDVRNSGAEDALLDVQLEVTGGVFRANHWGFSCPRNAPAASPCWSDGVFSLNDATGTRLAVSSSASLTPREPLCSGLLDSPRLTLAGGDCVRLYIMVAFASGAEADELIHALMRSPAEAIDASHRHWRERVKRLYSVMPSFACSDASWQELYDRSLLHLLLNEWDVPEFFLKPYYSTGSIGGGCLGSYLWNYGSPYHLWSMLDSKSAREHLLAYLSMDLGTYFAFQPDDGAPFGAYYPINQEKVILLTHAYVFQTKDTDFLLERCNGLSVIEHIIKLALYKDDVTRDAVLVDYGDGNHHLELQRGFRYDGILPDLNLRRCISMRLADELCHVIHFTPPVNLARRAENLKRLVKSTLFDAQAGWYRNLDGKGVCHLRYTMQMFKALGWGTWAMDTEEEQALLGHLMNPAEFLGDCGIHSMSKLDPAYDEFDVDNGGPGACPSFPAVIIERLYRGGHVQEAEAVFSRLKWLARHLPYWGDSQRADIPGYCLETSLQCDIEGATLAQAFIFGMFGIRVGTDFQISVSPHLPTGVSEMSLEHIRLAGEEFSIHCTREKTTCQFTER